MTRFTLSPRAQADIEDIWNISVERFGVDRAEGYLRDIHGAIDALASDPRRGRGCEDIREGYFKFPVGSHFLFFRLIPEGIDVVRILHAGMNFEWHMP